MSAVRAQRGEFRSGVAGVDTNFLARHKSIPNFSFLFFFALDFLDLFDYNACGSYHWGRFVFHRFVHLIMAENLYLKLYILFTHTCLFCFFSLFLFCQEASVFITQRGWVKKGERCGWFIENGTHTHTHTSDVCFLARRYRARVGGQSGQSTPPLHKQWINVLWTQWIVLLLAVSYKSSLFDDRPILSFYPFFLCFVCCPLSPFVAPILFRCFVFVSGNRVTHNVIYKAGLYSVILVHSFASAIAGARGVVPFFSLLVCGGASD